MSGPLKTRTLPAAVSANAAKTLTRPTWLVEVDYPLPDKLLLTSGAVITHELRTFDNQRLRVQSVTDTAATFIVGNSDNTISPIVSAHGANDVEVRIWKYYETDGVQLFHGYLDGCRMANKQVQFRATRIPAGMATFPERSFTRDAFPYLPEGEQEIRWNGAVYTLKGGR